MRLLVNIPEGIYNDIVNSNPSLETKKLNIILDAITNGKQIPDYHGPLIDANECVNEFDKDTEYHLSSIKDIIQHMTPVIPAVVVGNGLLVEDHLDVLDKLYDDIMSEHGNCQYCDSLRVAMDKLKEDAPTSDEEKRIFENAKSLAAEGKAHTICVKCNEKMDKGIFPHVKRDGCPPSNGLGEACLYRCDICGFVGGVSWFNYDY